jgi:hypothetical protein
MLVMPMVTKRERKEEERATPSRRRLSVVRGALMSEVG